MRAPVCAALLASSLACSTLVGADFDDLRERPAAGGTGGTSGAASTGGASGGSSQGGSNGGSENGGSENGGAGGQAGSAAAGGNAGSENGGSSGQSGNAGSAGLGGEAAAWSQGGQGGQGGAPGEPAVVVLNEIKGQGSGDDYIELYNLGPGEKTLTGYRLSDGGNTFVFPAGAVVAEQSFMLLRLQRLDTGGPFTCFDGGLPCYHADWAVSSANGEDVFFRDPSGQILDSTFYPDEDLASGLVDGQTWGRLPDGTGDFQATSITPEAKNAAL